MAIAICTSDVHTVWEGAVGDRHNTIPRVEWGVGMGHKQINGGLMPADLIKPVVILDSNP